MPSTGKKLIVRVVSGDSDNDDNDGDKEGDGRIHRRGSALSRRLVTERIQDARRREVCSGTCETESAKTQHPTVTLSSAMDRNKLAIGSSPLVHARELIIAVRLPCAALAEGRIFSRQTTGWAVGGDWQADSGSYLELPHSVLVPHSKPSSPLYHHPLNRSIATHVWVTQKPGGQCARLCGPVDPGNP